MKHLHNTNFCDLSLHGSDRCRIGVSDVQFSLKTLLTVSYEDEIVHMLVASDHFNAGTIFAD